MFILPKTVSQISSSLKLVFILLKPSKQINLKTPNCHQNIWFYLSLLKKVEVKKLPLEMCQSTAEQYAIN